MFTCLLERKLQDQSVGLQCEVGLRRKTYNVLAGSVLTVWNKVEAVLTHDGNRRGSNSKMQVMNVAYSVSALKVHSANIISKGQRSAPFKFKH